MMILLVMPIIQIILFGFAITTEVKNAKIAVLDPSKDVVTRQIIEKFQASPYFTVDRQIDNARQINEVFKQGDINLVLVFENDFASKALHTGQASVQLITDGTEPNQASMLTAYASNIFSSYAQEHATAQQPFQIQPELRMLYNPQSKGAYNFVPGVMGMIFILICAMMTSISIVREKELGTMEILLSSPLKPVYIVVAKAVPYFALSVVNLATVLLLSVYVLGVPVQGSLWLLLGVSFLFILLALTLGLFISTLVDTQMAAMLVSGMGLMMPIMLLSGIVFPIESMPTVLQYASTIIPARWYITAVKKIMIQGVTFPYVWQEVCIMAGMTIVLLMVSIKKFKTRLE